MPTVRVTLNDTYNTIFRPVVLTVTKQVQKLTGLKDTIPVFFPKDSDKNLTAGSGIDGTDEKGPRLPSGRYMFIEVEEDHNENSIATMVADGSDADPIFTDLALGVSLTPIYSTRDVKINFRYVCKSESEARRWREDMRSQVTRMRDVNQHSVSYYYTVPLSYVSLLMHIHKLRENVAGYNQTLDRYFRSNFCDRLTVVSSLDAKSRALAITETQSEISGRFDFAPLPEKPTKDVTDGTWSVSFSYNFTFNDPIDCMMRYPIMVHNQMLDTAYINWVNTDPSTNKHKLRYQGSRKSLRNYDMDFLLDKYLPEDQYLRLPIQDDYHIAVRPPGVGTAMMVLCNIEPSNKISLMNTRSLGDLYMDEDILQFMQESEYPYMTDIYKSIFHVSIYRNNARLHDTVCRVDPDLNVLGTEELNLRNQYRVHVGLVVDISLLTWDAINRLRNYPKAFVKIIASMNEILATHPSLKAMMKCRRILPYQFSEIYRLLTGMTYAGQNGSIGDTRILMPDGYSGGAFTKGNLFGDILAADLRRLLNARSGIRTVQAHGIFVYEV